MADAAASATVALKATGHEFLDIATEYLVPLGAAAAGFFTISASVGGFNTVWGILDKVPYLTNGGTANVNRVTGIILGVVYGGIGYAFWRMGHRGGWVMKLIGRGIGAYFLGGAGSMVLQIISPAAVSANGLIDTLAGDITSATGG